MSAAGKNPFYDPDEIDDDAFLKHPKAGRSGYLLPQYDNAPHSASRNPPSSSSTTPGFGTVGPSDTTRSTGMDQRQLLMQKRREIEERTVESSHRSLGLLYESEKVGQATAEELSRQKEQLKSTEQRLDDINSTLTQSERHLNGIKSIFGGLRNYFSGRNPSSAGSQTKLTTSQSESTMSGFKGSGNSGRSQMPGEVSIGGSNLDSLRNASHPGLRMRGLGEDQLEQSNADRVIDKNLEEMSMGLSRLKGLAINLNQELDEHNDIIDRLDHKTSTTHWRVEKQNKDMNKILKK